MHFIKTNTKQNIAKQTKTGVLISVDAVTTKPFYKHFLNF